MADYLVTDTELTSIANAIRNKGGTSASLEFPQEFIQAINDIETGGGGEPESRYDIFSSLKDVVLVDFDGSIVGNYSADEFLALDALPNSPQHDGLIAQGWNWTLAEAKEFVQLYGFLCIGQNYKTSDDCTRIYVTIDEITHGYTNYVMASTVSGTLTVDWGDGSSTQTITSSTTAPLSHKYQEMGDYVITLRRNGGATYRLGRTMSNMSLAGYTSSNSESYVSMTSIRKVEIGDGCVMLCRNCFTSGMINCQYITMPLSLETYGDGSNGQTLCAPFMSVVFPPAVNMFGGNNITSSMFISFHNINISGLASNATQFTGDAYMISGFVDYCPVAPSSNFMRYLCFAGGYTDVRGYSGRVGRINKKVCVPSTVTSIADYSYTDYKGDIYLFPTSPPTLANGRAVNVFRKYYVPYSADHSILNAYKTATNWSAYASKMEEMPQ